MGYVKGGTKRLHLPSAPEFWVEMRDRARWGDRQAANEASTTRYTRSAAELTPDDWNHVIDRTDDQCLVVRQDMQAWNRTILAGMIARWNLTGEDDEPLAITPESMGLLDDQDGAFLLEEAQKRLGRPKEQEGPFVEPSARPSPANGSSTPTSPELSIASPSASSGTAGPRNSTTSP